MNQGSAPIIELQGQRRYFRVRRRTAFIAVGGLVVLALLILILHPVWLTWAANYLNSSERPEKADAIVVLGGGRGQRCQYAARLYREGYAPTIFVMGGSNLGGCCSSEQAYMLEELLSYGLSQSVITSGASSTSTYEEAGNALTALRRAGARSAIIVTDPFHVRRASATFRKVWEGSDISARFCACDPSWFRAERWWTREREILAVFEEYEKLIYYWLSGKI